MKQSFNSFFGGLNNMVAPHLLGDSAAKCHNIEHRDGTLRPLKGAGGGVSLPVGTKSIFHWEGGWESSLSDRWYVEDGVRLLWADGDVPKKKTRTGEVSRLGIWNHGAAGVISPASVANACRVAETRWTYLTTYYSNPAKGGTGVESYPSDLTPMSNGNDTDPDTEPIQNGFVGALKANLGAAGDAANLTFSFFTPYKLDPTVFPAATSVTVKIDGELITGSLTAATAATGGLWENTMASCLRGQNGTTVASHNAGAQILRAFEKISMFVRRSGGEGITTIRLYRLLAGQFYLVLEVDNPTSGDWLQVDDTLTDADLLKNPILSTDSHWPVFVQNTTLATDLAPGAIIAKLENVTILEEGDPLVFEGGSCSSPIEKDISAAYTITGIDRANSQITFTPALAGSFTFPAGSMATVYPVGMAGPFNGMNFFWAGNTLGATNPGEPDFSDPSARLKFPSTIMAAVVFASFLVVLTKDGLYTISGEDPTSLYRTRIPGSLGCVAGRSAVRIPTGVLYLSSEGVVLFDGATTTPVSTDLHRSTFAGLAGINAAWHDGQYLLFHSTGAIVGRFLNTGPAWRTVSESALSCFRVDAEDTLYLCRGNQRLAWEQGNSLPWEYRTGELTLGDLSSEKQLHMLYLDAEGEVRIRVYIDPQYDAQGEITRGLVFDETLDSTTRTIHKRRMPMAARGSRPVVYLSGDGLSREFAFEFTGGRMR